MSLTDAKIRAAKPRQKPYRIFDGGGLYLEVIPSGGKWWRLKYRFDGKEKRLSLGTYPDIPLASSKNRISGIVTTGARDKRETARQLLAEGIDPSEFRKQEKMAKEEIETNTFKAIALECFNKLAVLPDQPTKPGDKRKTKRRNNPETKARKLAIFEKNVFPTIGGKPIVKVSAADILAVLERIEKRQAYETAKRVRIYCGQIFRYAIATNRAGSDPSVNLKEALAPISTQHHAAFINPDDIAGLMRAIANYKGYEATKYALQLAPLVFVRPVELRRAEWNHFDLEKAEWSIPGSMMKMGLPHLVPLSSQAVGILAELKVLTGQGRYVFPSVRSSARPMSENTVLAALRRMGFTKDEMTGHGFRAMARTVLDEQLGFRPDIIELQLAHAVKDPNGRAYNRTSFLPERHRMMQKWADYLEQLRGGAEFVPLRAA
jgi:integrase